MNWKAISFAILGIGGFLSVAVDSAADRQLASDVDRKAVLNRDEKTVEKLNEAVKTIEIVDDVTKRERKEISDEIRKWKLENDYDGRLNTIHQNARNELDEFKRSVNYFDRKDEIEEKAESSLDIFKESIDYDYEVSQLEEEIETAKTAYKKRTKLYELAGRGDDDISDTVSELKKAEKDKMDAAVKKASDKIQELKGKVGAEKNKIQRQRDSEMRALESEIQATRSKISKAENEAADAVRKELGTADAEIRAKITAKRSKTESEAMALYQECQDILEQQKQIDKENARELYDGTTKSEKWANWLNANNVPKWFVVTVGLVPYLPAGYLLLSYTKFLIATVRAM